MDGEFLGERGISSPPDRRCRRSHNGARGMAGAWPSNRRSRSLSGGRGATKARSGRCRVTGPMRRGWRFCLFRREALRRPVVLCRRKLSQVKALALSRPHAFRFSRKPAFDNTSCHALGNAPRLLRVKERILAIDDLGNAGAIRTDHRRATRHGLQDRQPESLVKRRKYEKGALGVEEAQVFIRDVAGAHYALGVQSRASRRGRSTAHACLRTACKLSQADRPLAYHSAIERMPRSFPPNFCGNHPRLYRARKGAEAHSVP